MDNNPSTENSIRWKAEELLKKKSLKTVSQLSEVESISLIHELQVHQIELELQNEELRHSWAVAEVANDKYSRLYDLAPSGYFTLSSKGEIIELNLNGARMLGKDRQHLKNSLFGFFVSEETKPIFSLFLEKAFKSKSKESCEVGVLTVGGSSIYIHLVGETSENGEQCQITAVDITELKLGENALHTISEKYRKDFNLLNSLLESPVDIIIFALDKNYCYTAFTKQHQETIKNIWGVDIHIGLNMLNVISDPKDRQKAKANFDRALQGECFILTEEYGDEKLYRTYYEDYYSSIKESDGSIVGVSVFVVDVTLRVQAQDALKEAEWKFRALFEKGPIGVAYHKMIYDNSGKPVDYYFIDANERYQELTGVDPRGKTVKQAFPGIENDSFNWIETFGHVARTGEQIRFEQYLQPNSRWYDCVGYQYKPDHFVAAFIEITERKLIDKKLFSQTMLLEAQLNSTIDGILIVDQDNQRILINRRMIELFKVPVDIIEDKNDSKLLEYVTSLTKNPGRFLEKIVYLNDNPDKVSSDEIEFVNGMVIDRYSAPVISRDGKNYGRIWIFRDITDRRNAEKKVREKETQFGKLSSQLPDLIFQFTRKPDGSYCVPIASSGIMNIFGCLPEDVRDDFGPIARVIFPEDSDRVIRDIEYSAKHLSYFTCEFRVQIPGRDIQWIFSRSAPEKLEDGSITWYGFNADITAIKRTEEILIESNELRKSLLQTIPFGMDIVDESGNILFLSDNLKQQFGADALGKKCWNLYRDDKKQCSDCPLRSGIKIGETKIYESPGVLGGKTFEIYHTGMIHTAQKAMLEVFVDITERKLAEKEILELNSNLELRVKQRTLELEAANKELETFSYSISHDLKAPLRHITGFIGLFLENKSKELSKEDLGYLEVISSSASEMGKLVDGILNFSKLNAIELQKTRIRSSEIVQQVIKFFDPEIQNRKITFQVETLPEVKADEELIRQVWINLISNAIKYTMKKPEAVIEIGSSSTDNEITFYIKDNGAGFNMKYAEKLFGVFQRLHKTSDFEGVGIGLANVNRIVTRHGGHCRAEGDVDKGATFYFSLPK